MNTRDASQDERLRTRAEAAVWMALLHSPNRNEAIESGLRRWIAADPSHSVAWEAATDLWNETADLPRRFTRANLLRNRRPSWRAVSYVACGVACAILAIVGVTYFGRYTITTGVGEQRTFTLDDGSRVELNTDSRLKVKFNRKSRTLFLESGEAYFRVAHELRPFIVIAGNQKITALGTEFTVRRDMSGSNALTVTLMEGKVTVAPLDENKVPLAQSRPDLTLLQAGQRLKILEHAQPVMDTPAMDKATGWTHGRLIFDHTPLGEAADEISRYSTVKITVPSPDVARISVGGSFRIGDTSNFISAVAASHHLRVTTRADGRIVLESDNE